MTLPLPNLDNRQWIDLVDEGRAMIPRYAPDWTDHNASDPGITIMELLAWLSEMTNYRLNRVPERHLRKFLALLGFYPHPPLAAQTMLSFMPDEGSNSFVLPAGVEFAATGPNGAPILFRTMHDITVSFVALNALQLEQLKLSVEPNEQVFSDLTRDWLDGSPLALLGRDPQTEPALYLGFETLPAETPIAIAFHFRGQGVDRAERARLIREAAEQRKACRPIVPDILCDNPLVPLLPSSAELLLHHSVQLVWEILTDNAPEQWTALRPVVGRVRPEVGEVMDDTRAFTLNGVVELNLPNTLVRATIGQVAESLFYLRCRLLEGSYDAPPILAELAINGVQAEQAVPVSQDFLIAAGATINGTGPDNSVQPMRFNFTLDNDGVIQTITFLEFDDAPDHPDLVVLGYGEPGQSTPESAGNLTIQAVLLGRGNGRPDQRARLPQAPVQGDSLQLYTHAGGAWQRWTSRKDFDASNRMDFDFVLNETSGEIIFGNGEYGCVVPSGVLVVATYRVTRAMEGNVNSGAITHPAETLHNDILLPESEREQLSNTTINNLQMTNGADAEPLTKTIGRAVETLHAHQRLLDLCAEASCASLDDVALDRVLSIQAPTRGVNLLDIERLALNVPGTHIVRVRAFSSNHPGYPCLHAEGVTTVVMIPDLPVPKPEPSAGLLKVVKRYLDRRRTITTRIEVVGPQYLEVRVDATVRARPFADITKIKGRIIEALNTFLNPSVGGPDGRGWPFGRNVYRSEILQLIDAVMNVDHVLELSLRTINGSPQCGNILVCPTWLVASGEHRIEVIRGES